MKNSVKILFTAFAILSLSVFFAACAFEDDTNDNGADTASEETIDNSQDEALSQGNLTEINIYLYGIKNPLPLKSNMGVFLVNALNDTIEAAGDTDALGADSSGISAGELMNAYTCLELIYDSPVDLPLTQSGEAFRAARILYAIYAGDNGENILYTGRDNYYQASMGTIADMSFANILDQFVKSDVQKAVFSENLVTVAGMTMEYLSEQSDDIEAPMLSQMLYNAIAFYTNSYKKNFTANTNLMTEALTAALSASADNVGSGNSHGEDIILQMDNYFDYREPASVQAVYDGHLGDYFVYLDVDGTNILQIVFVNLDGYPYVESCYLMSV